VRISIVSRTRLPQYWKVEPIYYIGDSAPLWIGPGLHVLHFEGVEHLQAQQLVVRTIKLKGWVLCLKGRSFCGLTPTAAEDLEGKYNGHLHVYPHAVEFPGIDDDFKRFYEYVQGLAPGEVLRWDQLR
jgi:hypothetical protein